MHATDEDQRAPAAAVTHGFPEPSRQPRSPTQSPAVSNQMVGEAKRAWAGFKGLLSAAAAAAAAIESREGADIRIALAAAAAAAAAPTIAFGALPALVQSGAGGNGVPASSENGGVSQRHPTAFASLFASRAQLLSHPAIRAGGKRGKQARSAPFCRLTLSLSLSRSRLLARSLSHASLTSTLPRFVLPPTTAAKPLVSARSLPRLSLRSMATRLFPMQHSNRRRRRRRRELAVAQKHDRRCLSMFARQRPPPPLPAQPSSKPAGRWGGRMEGEKGKVGIGGEDLSTPLMTLALPETSGTSSFSPARPAPRLRSPS